jgi:dimeric dUTPase (all-alpha-NTP-PPase superfamily)
MSNYQGYDYEEFDEVFLEDTDSLYLIFKKQIEFQKLLNNDITKQEFYNIMTIAQIDEIMESTRETPWKPWKKQQQLNRMQLKEELIDEFHFFINRCIFAELTPGELIKGYFKKNKENIERQTRGY